jgi:hypothetical protein
MFNAFNGDLTVTVETSELQAATNMTRTGKLSLSPLTSPLLKSDY